MLKIKFSEDRQVFLHLKPYRPEILLTVSWFLKLKSADFKFLHILKLKTANLWTRYIFFYKFLCNGSTSFQCVPKEVINKPSLWTAFTCVCVVGRVAGGVLMCGSQELTSCIFTNWFTTEHFPFFEEGSLTELAAYRFYQTGWPAPQESTLFCLLLLEFTGIEFTWLHMDTGDLNSGSQACSELEFELLLHFPSSSTL